jgi:peptidoglycan/LPS O-acetylase OafA/YrhL
MSTNPLDLLIFLGMLVLFAFFLVLEYATIRQERGIRRWLAILPAMVVGWIVLGILLNPAAHTLWMIEIVLWLIPAIVVLLLLRGFRSTPPRTDASGETRGMRAV